MGGQDNATSADEADIAMNVQGLHGEPRETRGTTIGNTGNYEKKGQNGNEENGHNGNKENGHGKATKAKEMLLSLIKKLPADQRRMLSGKLRAMEADTTIDQGRKAEIAGAFISKLRAEARASDEASYTKAAEPLEEEMPENTDVGEEAKANKVDEVEANATQVKEPSEAPAAPGEPREEPRTAHEKLRLLIKRLTVDQRNALSVQLRVLEQDTSISQGRKAEIARGIIAKAAEPQEEQRGILEEQTKPDEDMPKRVEVPCAAGSAIAGSAFECGIEDSQGPGRAWEATKSYALSLSEHRKDMLRVILNDEAIDREWKDKMVSDLLTNWFNEDAQGRAILESAEEQPDRVNLSVGEVVSSGVDIDNGKQDMGVLAPLGEQQGKEIAEECEKRQSCAGENHDQLLPEVMAVSSGSNTRGVDDVWGGYTDNCYRVFEEKIGDFGAIDTQNITKGDLVEHSGQRLGDLIDFGGLKEASVSHGTVDVLGDEAGVSVFLDEQPVAMDKVESEEMFYLGKIEIGVCAGEPYIAKEREVSVITSMEIIAGDDVKEKDIGKSGDFQVGGAIRDDSIVSIMSMDYEGCCFQEESMETQRQERDVVDYNSDDGDTTSAKFKYGRPAFAPGGIGMFVVTGRPPGRLIGG